MGLLIVLLMLVLLCIVITKILPRIFGFFDRKYTPEEIRKKRPRLIKLLATLSLLSVIGSIMTAESVINIRSLRRNLDWQETLVKEGEAEYKGNVFKWEDYSPKRRARTLHSIRYTKAQIRHRPFLILSYSLWTLLGVLLFIGFLHLKAWLLRVYVTSVIMRFIVWIPMHFWMSPKEPELLTFRVICLCGIIIYWGAQILIIYYLMKPEVRQLYQSA